jgi:hypothetical protein
MFLMPALPARLRLPWASKRHLAATTATATGAATDAVAGAATGT